METELVVSYQHDELFLERVMKYADSHELLTHEQKKRLVNGCCELNQQMCQRLEVSVHSMSGSLLAAKLVRNFVSVGLEVFSSGNVQQAARYLASESARGFFTRIEERYDAMMVRFWRFKQTCTLTYRDNKTYTETECCLVSNESMQILDGVFCAANIHNIDSKDLITLNTLMFIVSEHALLQLESTLQNLENELGASRQYAPWKQFRNELALTEIVRQRGQDYFNADISLEAQWHLGSLLMTMVTHMMMLESTTNVQTVIIWNDLKAMLPRVNAKDFVVRGSGFLYAYCKQHEIPERQTLILMNVFEEAARTHLRILPGNDLWDNDHIWMGRFHIMMNVEEYFRAQVRLHEGSEVLRQEAKQKLQEMLYLTAFPETLEQAREVFKNFAWEDVEEPDALQKLLEKFEPRYVLALMPLSIRHVEAIIELTHASQVTKRDADRVIVRLLREHKELCEENGLSSVAMQYVGESIARMKIVDIPLNYYLLSAVTNDWQNVDADIAMKKQERHAFVEYILARVDARFWKEMPDELRDCLKYQSTKTQKAKITRNVKM